MNRAETVQLCRLVKSMCASQTFDEFTPDAWALILGHVSYEDAKAAVVHLSGLDLEPGHSRYIEPGHIIAQVKRIRAKRLENHAPVDPPSGLSTGEYLTWLRATNEAIASGQEIAPRASLAADPERGMNAIAEEDEDQ